MSSIKKKAISGTIWTIAGYGSSQILRLGGNIILTRLLVPELFGLMALMNTFIMGLNLFSDIGIRPSIIRSSRGDDPVFLNTAWTLQVIRGFVLWLGCCIIAWPIAQFYGNSQLMWLLPIVGLASIISGFNSTSLATLNRKIEINRLTKFEITQQILSLSITVVWAYFQRAIWALVGGSLLGKFIKMVRSYQLDPNLSHRFILDRESVKELVSFGRWIFISTAMTFLAEQSDRLILGRLVSLPILGVYTIAIVFSEMPKTVVKKITTQVMFPVVSKHIDLPNKTLLNKILPKRWLILLGLIIIITALAGFGDLIVSFLYDTRYQDAGWMLSILGLGMWPLILAITIDKVLFARGNPSYVALGNSLKFVWMIIGLPLAFRYMGMLGAILIIAFNDLPFYIAVNYGLWREKMMVIGQDVKATLILIAALTLILGTRYFLGFGLPLDKLMV